MRAKLSLGSKRYYAKINEEAEAMIRLGASEYDVITYLESMGIPNTEAALRASIIFLDMEKAESSAAWNSLWQAVTNIMENIND